MLASSLCASLGSVLFHGAFEYVKLSSMVKDTNMALISGYERLARWRDGELSG